MIERAFLIGFLALTLAPWGAWAGYCHQPGQLNFLKKLKYSDAVAERILKRMPEVAQRIMKEYASKKNLKDYSIYNSGDTEGRLTFFRGLELFPHELNIRQEGTFWATYDLVYAVGFAISARHGNALVSGSGSNVERSWAESTENLKDLSRQKRKYGGLVLKLQAPAFLVESYGMQKGELSIQDAEPFIEKVGLVRSSSYRALEDFDLSEVKIDWFDWESPALKKILNPHQR